MNLWPYIMMELVFRCNSLLLLKPINEGLHTTISNDWRYHLLRLSSLKFMRQGNHWLTIVEEQAFETRDMTDTFMSASYETFHGHSRNTAAYSRQWLLVRRISTEDRDPTSTFSLTRGLLVSLVHPVAAVILLEWGT